MPVNRPSLRISSATTPTSAVNFFPLFSQVRAYGGAGVLKNLLPQVLYGAVR